MATRPFTATWMELKLTGTTHIHRESSCPNILARQATRNKRRYRTILVFLIPYYKSKFNACGRIEPGSTGGRGDLHDDDPWHRYQAAKRRTARGPKDGQMANK